MKVYWTSIEFNYIKSSQKLKGGFVYAFATASDVREALELFLMEFKNKDLQIRFIEFISPYDAEMEWEIKRQTNHFKKLYKEAIKSKDVILDDFYSYEEEI